MKIKNLFLHFCKGIGFFTLSARVYHSSLQILCYHGLSFEDEHIFNPGTFMTKDTFAKRLAYLRDNDFKVLELGNAIERLRTNTLKPKSVVITIDDGFYSFYKLGVPLLKKYGYASTLYVTSYYVRHPNPVFRLAMEYIFWKSGQQETSFFEMLTDLKSSFQLKEAIGQGSLLKLIEYAENNLNEIERNNLLEEIAKFVDVDYKRIRDQRLFSLVTTKEIKSMQSDGVDIQLHTHRHRLPRDPLEIENEIVKNREVLAPVLLAPLEHLCYPSGIWSDRHWPTLTKCKIETATTCDPGLNKSNSQPLALTRYLDRENFTDIEFDAELSCFKEIVRNVRAKLST